MLFDKKPERHVVIIGNGIAGVSCARKLRQRDKKVRITLVSGESPYFFSRPALMYIYMGHLTFEGTQPYETWWWQKQRIGLRQAWVTHIDTQKKWLTFAGDAGGLAYDQLVLATGSKPNRFGWPGQDLERVQGLCSLQELHTLERVSHEIEHGVIVGGGLIGIELAEMLHSRGKRVTVFSREGSYWSNALPREESLMVSDVIEKSGIKLMSNTELKEIVDDGQGRACAVVTGTGERIACQFVGLTAGVSPNLSALKGSTIPTGRGVLVDFSFRSTVDDVFAIGDCAELVVPGGRNRIEQLWYTGQMHGEVLADVLCGDARTYDRGIWFNSAKFIDLEWHTYGEVPPAAGPAVRASVRQTYWEAPDRRHSFRLVWENNALIGVNAMGIRYRHKICERWIAEKRDPDYVFSHLSDGNFDPEFYRRFEKDIVRGLRAQLQETAA